MLNWKGKNSFFWAIILLVTACSEGQKTDVPAISSSNDQKIVVENNDIDKRFHEVSNKLEQNLIDAREAGKLIGNILEANQTDDLNRFNYEKSNRIFSQFSKTLRDRFGSESENSLIFLAETLKINTLSGFDQKSKTEKEQAILARVGALREKSYLEMEFFLANYFLNNKIFESLKNTSTDTKDEDLTFCKGYLIKFVKDIYTKNARYPDAFNKYAIWGEVLNECNLAPIYLSSLGQIKTSFPEEVKAEQLILANILKSKEIKDYSGNNLVFDQKTPAVIKSLMNHTLFVARALNNKDQIVFDLDSVNNSLNVLDKLLSNATTAEDASLFNLADHLWFDLFLNLKDSLNARSSMFEVFFGSPEKRQTLNPLLFSIGLEITGQFAKDDLNRFLETQVKIKQSAFLDKWSLMKDSIMASGYISALSKKPLNQENEKALHLLKMRLDHNILMASRFNSEEVLTSSIDPLYQGLSIHPLLVNSVYVESGKSVLIEELELETKPVVLNVLAKAITKKSVLEISLDNIRSGYLDFTPQTESRAAQIMTPFVHQMPLYNIVYAGESQIGRVTEFGCVVREEVIDREAPAKGGSHPRTPPCLGWRAHNYSVTTKLPERPSRPLKVERARNGIQVILKNSQSKKSLVVFANGENGFKGVKGTDSPLCLNGNYNSFTENKNGTFAATTNAARNEATILANISNTKADVEAGVSGEGGDAGNGGSILFQGKISEVSLVALGGIGGDKGEAASCTTITPTTTSKLDYLDSRSAVLFGKTGTNGNPGSITRN